MCVRTIRPKTVQKQLHGRNPTKATLNFNQLILLDPKKIKPNPLSRRTLKASGVLQSLLVRPSRSSKFSHETIAGDGRRELAIKNGLPFVPAIVRTTRPSHMSGSM